MIAIERAVLPGVRSKDFDLIQFVFTQRICAVDVESFLIVSGLMTLNNLGDRGAVSTLGVQHELPLGVGEDPLVPRGLPPVGTVLPIVVMFTHIWTQAVKSKERLRVGLGLT